MDVKDFSEIADDFHARVSRIVWCTVATTDRQGRLRSRILHPIWEGPKGWIMTGRNTLKTKHLEASPWISLTYWDPQHEQVYADCKATWNDDEAEQERIWALFKETPEPYGYDPSIIWPDGPSSPECGLLELDPWRIEVSGLGAMMTGQPPRVWRG